MSPSPTDAAWPSGSPSPRDAAVPGGPPSARGGALWRALGARVALRFGPPDTLFITTDRVLAWAPDAHDRPTTWASASAWFDAHRGHAARVVLGNALTRQIVVADPASPLDEPALLAAWARQQFATYHGSATQAWPIAPWLMKDQKGACALTDFDLDALRRSARAAGVRLRSVEPWWSLALAAVSGRIPSLDGAAGFRLGVVEGSVLTWLVCEGGRVIDVVQRRTASATSAALIVVVDEAMAGVGVDRPVVMVGYGLADDGPWPAHWLVPDRLDATVPSLQGFGAARATVGRRSWARGWPTRDKARAQPQPDFIATQAAVPVWVATAAVAGVVLLGLGVSDVLDRRAAIAHERGRALRPPATASTVAAAPRAATPREAEALRVASRYAAQSRHPWGELFAAIESAAPSGVQWLAFDHASDSTDVHLEGIATDAEGALRAVDALAAQPGWSSAALTRLAAPETAGQTAAAAIGMRFAVTAQWRGDDPGLARDVPGEGASASIATPSTDVITLATSSAPIEPPDASVAPTRALEPGRAR